MKNQNQNSQITFRVYIKDNIQGLRFVSEHTTSDETIKIGAGSAANLRLDDGNVALMHSYVTLDSSGEYVISDVVSKSGTLVNGHKVQRAVLKDGDEITVGDYVLIFARECAPAPEQLAATPQLTTTPPTEYPGAPALMVTTKESGAVVQKTVITKRTGNGMMAKVVMAAGAALLITGLLAGYASLRRVNEQAGVNVIIKEIAKERGLSDKFIPAVRGSRSLELSFIALSILGSLAFFAGFASWYGRRKRSESYSVGEDPEATYHMDSKRLPGHRFTLAQATGAGNSIQIPEAMEFSLQKGGVKYKLTDLITTGLVSRSQHLPGTWEYAMTAGDTASLSRGDTSFEISATRQPALILPFNLPREAFHLQALIWVFVMAGLATYFTYIQKDELFSDSSYSDTPTVQMVMKDPMVALKIQEKKLKKVVKKDEKPKENIYKPVASKNVATKSAPRDPRNVAKNSGGPGNGDMSGLSNQNSRSGVANVLASSINAMTASLTASNTVFGQESEDFDDLLGDDPDGEMMSDGGFTGRGPGGIGGPGSLGIFGPPTEGFSGIDPNGGIFGPNANIPRIPGITRRPIRTRDGQAEVIGKLDPNEVRQVIRGHRSQVHHCYMKGLMMNNSLKGVVRVSFLINMGGRVARCSVTDNLSVPSVGTCICSALSGWKFPQPQGGLARIAYSWTLSPGN